MAYSVPSWANPPFRFHLLSEPHSLDPQSTSGTGGNYLFHAIYRGLFRFHSQRGLILEGAKSCKRTPLVLTCTLNPQHRWSLGGAIQAQDYVRSFQRLVDPVHKSAQAEVLFNVKNAREIWLGQKPVKELGVTAVDSVTLRIEFSQEDPEFEWKLIQPALSPWPATGLVDERKNVDRMNFSGPYRIVSWTAGQVLRLTANPGYGLKARRDRPDIEALIVSADSTALRLYENNRLSFLRRLPAAEIPRFKKSPEFLQVPMARFDYVGFGPDLNEQPDLRKALSQALDFRSFQIMFDALGPPGCPSLPSRLMDRLPCIKPDFAQSRELLKKVKSLPKLQMHFSQLGGDDIARAAEWFQGQWKKNLKLEVQLSSVEQGVYLQRLKVRPPPIFRKGVSLDRPTCLAALELFTLDHPENFVGFKDDAFDGLVKKLATENSESKKKQLCREGMEALLASTRLIPLGQMYFSILVKPEFKDWDINELNQLDLTDLTYVPSSPGSR